jgi:hypothetical protein
VTSDRLRRHSAKGEPSVREEGELPATYNTRPISRELRRLLDAPPTVDVQRSGEKLVARVLRDL